jgi:hypothetical protein
MNFRTLQFMGNVFFRRKTTIGKILVSFFLYIFSFHSFAKPPIAQDTTSPNVFWFTSETYHVDEDGTNAIVTVEFSPGDRSWSGWVNYSVSNGTAIAGQDYTAVSGTLYFSGPGTPIPRITIPVHKDALVEGSETVQLFLWNTNAIITRSNATLIIDDKVPAPQLVISPGANGTITLSWPSEFADFVLEKSGSAVDASWSDVSSPRNLSNGVCNVTENCSGPPMFYRLKKASSP